MGKPILGEHSRLEVIILESCEFKVSERLMDGNTLAPTKDKTSIF